MHTSVQRSRLEMPAFVLCPRCELSSLKQTSLNKIECSNCKTCYSSVDDIPILLLDTSLRTQLESIDYDSLHKVNSTSMQGHYEKFKLVLENYNFKGKKVLEIGSGTGLLTYGLATDPSFHYLVATDLSPTFLKVARSRITEPKGEVHYYACDANALPFAQGYFDCIVGNAILHHLLYYQKTLEQCYRILPVGGLAMFCEPVIQGKIIVAFMIELMIRLDRSLKLHIFDQDEVKRMKSIVEHQTISVKIGDDMEQLARMEDKYIFDIEEMVRLGSAIGFTEVKFFNYGEKLFKSYQPYVSNHLRRIRIPQEKVEKFNVIFDSFGYTFGRVTPNQIKTPMGFFVFKK